MTVKYWTDYPFTELGDEGGKIAPIREITILEWDRNKYVKIIVEGIQEEIKAGYIYTQPGRCGKVPSVSFPRKHIDLY